MPLEPIELKRELRLLAIEYMIGHLYKMITGAMGASPALIERSINDFRESLKDETFPTFHPALSDLAAGEMQEAFEHLLDIMSEMSGVAKKREG